MSTTEGTKGGQFSWSVSRSGTLSECPRSYYYRYYLANGGWRDGASEEAREADLLKRCKNRWAWAGIAVHDVIADVLREVRDGGWVSAQDAEARLTERMRSDWKRSNKGHYRDDRKAPALLEHEYRQGIPDRTWQELFQNCLRSMRNFYKLDVLRELRATPAERWKSLENMTTFELDGVPVWVVMDLAYVNADGQVVIVDWKTGKKKSPDYTMQLFCYGLYASAEWPEASEGIRLDLAYTYREEVDSVPYTGEGVEEVTRQIRESVAEMKERLVDAEANVAREEDFEARPDTWRCKSCSFQRLCERRGVFVQGATGNGSRWAHG